MKMIALPDHVVGKIRDILEDTGSQQYRDRIIEFLKGKIDHSTGLCAGYEPLWTEEDEEEPRGMLNGVFER